MNSVQKKRLQKLTDFLKKVPNKHFDLAYLVKDNDGCDIENFTKNMKNIAKGKEITCGTIGCAVGWMPVIFKDFKYIKSDDSFTFGSFFSVINTKTENSDSLAVQEFFGIDEYQAGYLFLEGNYNDSSKNNVIKRILNFIKKDGNIKYVNSVV